MISIHTILEEFKQDALSTRDQGDKFERLIAHYLRTESLHRNRFSDVWLWNDWPDRGKQTDTGIDLIAKEHNTGDYLAIEYY